MIVSYLWVEVLWPVVYLLIESLDIIMLVRYLLKLVVSDRTFVKWRVAPVNIGYLCIICDANWIICRIMSHTVSIFLVLDTSLILCFIVGIRREDYRLIIFWRALFLHLDVGTFFKSCLVLFHIDNRIFFTWSQQRIVKCFKIINGRLKSISPLISFLSVIFHYILTFFGVKRMTISMLWEYKPLSLTIKQWWLKLLLLE